jgi:thiamine transport system substrate-binding protein
LQGATNPAGANELVEFLLSDSFQSTIPGLMYVYPVNADAVVPTEWAQFGPPAKSTIGESLDIADNRVSWQDKWSVIFD